METEIPDGQSRQSIHQLVASVFTRGLKLFRSPQEYKNRLAM